MLTTILVVSNILMICYIISTFFVIKKEGIDIKKSDRGSNKDFQDNDTILEKMNIFKKNKRRRDHMMDLLINNLKDMK